MCVFWRGRHAPVLPPVQVVSVNIKAKEYGTSLPLLVPLVLLASLSDAVCVRVLVSVCVCVCGHVVCVIECVCVHVRSGSPGVPRRILFDGLRITYSSGVGEEGAMVVSAVDADTTGLGEEAEAEEEA